MKQLVLAIVMAFGTIAATAQTPPSAAARIGNRTACDIYVKLMVTNGSCTLTLTSPITVAPYGVVSVPAPSAGWWYDGALVSDEPTFSGMCYYQKVSVPWALCTPYPVTSVGPSCCGPNLISTWGAGGSPTSPFLIIYQ